MFTALAPVVTIDEICQTPSIDGDFVCANTTPGASRTRVTRRRKRIRTSSLSLGTVWLGRKTSGEYLTLRRLLVAPTSFLTARLVGREVEHDEAHDQKPERDQGRREHPIHLRSPRLRIRPIKPEVKLIAK